MALHCRTADNIKKHLDYPLLMNLLYILFFPGVILHEFSHYLACLATGVKVFEVRFFGGSEAYVRHARAGLAPSVIITLAPFFVSNIAGFLLLREAHFIAPYSLAGLVFYWAGISAVFFSFPSDGDAKNSFRSFIAMARRRLFTGSITARVFWLPAVAFIFLPLSAVLSAVIFFNYVFFLRLLWLLFFISLTF
jgi:hypothetical protein